MQFANSIIAALGYQVLALSDGVYRLMAQDSPQQFVAVLRAPAPLAVSASEVTLVLFPVEAGVQVDRVMEHWKNLDARRIGSADATVVSVSIPPGSVPGDAAELTYLRPDGSGLRYAVKLSTGDVVCFN